MAEHRVRDPQGACGTAPSSSLKTPGAPRPSDANPREGLDREVGDLEDPNAVEDDGALPGRVGGGLAGG